ncbi:Protein of unknown function [Collimonas sp. OK607]|uniref:DUF1302 domain-containing protein n=1 Tax=Collimonas sp. OK607 TaxID=1798194 RepID=UPI0008ED3CC4|nr:DUF1302 domain-containing protein [Collimonas sp. OK607]SFB34619.1 Protein of unknown function [Collimonas sp. OK607]
MKKKHGRKSQRGFVTNTTALQLFAAVLASQGAMSAHAFEIESGNPDVKIHWDNTLKYSTAFRLKDASGTLLADPNQDDGDRNFGKGVISNRVDLLSEFDVKYKDHMGVRVSGAAWYDSIYHQTNDNNSPGTANNISVPYNQFNSATRSLHGGSSEILDAFVYDTDNIGGIPSTVRLGRHTVLYGETVFFGSNGIAGGQAPTDVVKLLSVPGSQFKEIVRPVNQLSTQFQVKDNLAIGAYYQFEWRKTLIPGEGSYFSGGDVVDGSERFFLGPPFPPGAALFHTRDQAAKNSGQGGMQIRWRPSNLDVELGLYAIRYNEKTPQFYASTVLTGGTLNPAIGEFGTYQLVYPEGVKAYGASFSTQIGDANVAGEVSVRRNTPLVSDPTIFGVTTTATSGNNNSNPAYAVGNSAHANLSTIYLAPPTGLWNTASFVGEIAWNRRTSVTKNPEAVAANSSRDAWALRFLFEPAWFQVAPGLDLSAPVGVGYSPHGNSSVVSQFNAGGKNGGDLSLGIKGTYQQVWHFGLTYTNFFGSAGTGLNSLGQLSFKQNLSDRNFIAATVQRSF